MTLEELVDHYGSQYRIAKVFGYTRQAVSNWNTKGYIPLPTQYRIEVLTQGQFKAKPPKKGKKK